MAAVLFSPAINRTVLFGASAWLSVPVTAVPPLTYQWSFNGTNSPGPSQYFL